MTKRSFTNFKYFIKFANFNLMNFKTESQQILELLGMFGPRDERPC